jgi:GntR family transcriptional repressor for pyruvate dehydrogenase complex
MSNDNNPAPPSELFKTLQRESTLSDRVTGQIEKLIIANHLQPGDHLPPERELARQFGVSRTVVREAIRALVAKSLLETRAGGGTVVRSPTAASVAQSMSLFLRAGQSQLDYNKVLEVRRILEVEIAGLAAERRTAEDLVKMEQILVEAASGEGRDHFAKTDVAFHAALARATHNELFGLLLDSVADIMFKVRYLGFDIPDAIARALRYHGAIFDQVKAGDAEGARQAMREHLIESEDTQRQAMALHAGQPLSYGQDYGKDSKTP